jgi:hypothetical protein
MGRFASELDGIGFMPEDSARDSVHERIERILCAVVLLAALAVAAVS